MNYWVVGADWSGEDKTAEFLESGNWENGYHDKFTDLVNKVEVGDQIAIKTTYVQKNNLPFENYCCDVSCMKIKAVGQVIENVKNGKQLKVHWHNEINHKIIYLYTYRPTISRVVDTMVQSIIFKNHMQDFNELEKIYLERSQNTQANQEMKEKHITEKETNLQKSALNRILFGAAGTGKTFNTINHALSIIENKSLGELMNETREELKVRFDTYKNQGQIKFVTFHQSFSYEDFVEGIRAETNDQGSLAYNVQAGVFKEICTDAKIEVISKKNRVNVPTELSINNAIKNLIEHAKKTEQIFYTKRNSEIKVTSNPSGTLFALNSKDTTITLSIRHIRIYLKTGQDNIIDNKAYEWAIAKSLRSEVEYEKTNPDSSSRPYVLIIDEINRGNISRIFGELITLIEDSKRAGADEALSVTLPYSKEEFSVPNNVYIIGTMNSSDRSLTGLDIALRRRFTFIEMPPKPELLNDVVVEGLEISRLLKVMNQRIEVLLDRDHCIGHANFMSLNRQSTVDDLAQIFKQKVIPQLQEYFFDDWSKISLVLYQNGMIIEDDEINISTLFPANAQLDIDYSEQKKIWKINDEVFKTMDAFIKILGAKG